VAQQAFITGATRQPIEGRFDLISPEGLRRLALTYQEGAEKYGDNNWRKGMPFSSTLNHAIKHIFQYISGDTSEDHLAHAAWGLLAVMEYEKTHPDLNDLHFHNQVSQYLSLTIDEEEVAGG
jgi:hypothetical protein